MANKTTFTDREWEALCDAPQLVGLAIALAGASGITGTIKETFASSVAIAEGTRSESELIRAICQKDEVETAQRGMRESLLKLKSEEFAAVKQQLAQQAIDRARAGIDALEKKAPVEVAAYRGFVKALGERVAQAAKEGGFLGFGGERVSAEEKALLAKLDEALGGSA